MTKYVALRKESVDRNDNVKTAVKEVVCRSPQGERGQKYLHTHQKNAAPSVALRKESVDRNWQATANITQGKNKKGKFFAEFCLTHCKYKIELL